MNAFKWLLKKYLYYSGVRFYESKISTSGIDTYRYQYLSKTIGHVYTFEFYREIFTDKVYKRGKFFESDYHVFIIRARFENGILDERLIKFNDTRLLCKHLWFPVIPDDVIVEVLEGLYLAYITHLSTLEEKP